MLAAELEECKDFPVLQELLSKEDILDARSMVSDLANKLSQVKTNAARRPRPLQTGRRPVSDTAKRIESLKKAMRVEQHRGDDQAGRILEKLQHVPEPVQVKNGKATAKAKSRRRIRSRVKKLRYKRQSGDELRLIKKREIATCPRYCCAQFLF